MQINIEIDPEIIAAHENWKINLDNMLRGRGIILSDRHLSIITWRDFGYKTEEIGKILGITGQAVRGNIRKIRRIVPKF